MFCPKCGSGKVRRSARRGLKEGVLLRLINQAPFRCNSCGCRFKESLAGHNFVRSGTRQGLAAFLGLRRGQRATLNLAIIASIIVVCLIITLIVVSRSVPDPKDYEKKVREERKKFYQQR